jgi:hypothetical protein
MEGHGEAEGSGSDLKTGYFTHGDMIDSRDE